MVGGGVCAGWCVVGNGCQRTLYLQVRQLQEDAVRLQSAYAGDKADDIQRKDGEVLEAWRILLEACDCRRLRLLDTGDKFRFFSMVRDLLLWMDDVIRLIEAQENPRWVRWWFR